LPVVENVETEITYDSFQAGIDEASSGNTLKLLRNITLITSTITTEVDGEEVETDESVSTIPEGLDITFDLNGYQINQSNTK